MKVLSLLADTILTCILEAALDTTLARPLVSCKGSVSRIYKRQFQHPPTYHMSGELSGTQSKRAEPSCVWVSKDPWSLRASSCRRRSLVDQTCPPYRAHRPLLRHQRRRCGQETTRESGRHALRPTPYFIRDCWTGRDQGWPTDSASPQPTHTNHQPMRARMRCAGEWPRASKARTEQHPRLLPGATPLAGQQQQQRPMRGLVLLQEGGRRVAMLAPSRYWARMSNRREYKVHERVRLCRVESGW